VTDIEAVRLSPLGHAHVNMLVRYAFPKPAAATQLRPLRAPDADDRTDA
jgi:hypothetical protein